MDRPNLRLVDRASPRRARRSVDWFRVACWSGAIAVTVGFWIPMSIFMWKMATSVHP